MPFAQYFLDDDFTPEQRRIYALAFKVTLRKLNLVDRDDPISEIVARKIIEVGSSGAANAVAISEIAYRQLVPR